MFVKSESLRFYLVNVFIYKVSQMRKFMKSDVYLQFKLLLFLVFSFRIIKNREETKLQFSRMDVGWRQRASVAADGVDSSFL